jgi:hypothetical protein
MWRCNAMRLLGWECGWQSVGKALAKRFDTAGIQKTTSIWDVDQNLISWLIATRDVSGLGKAVCPASEVLGHHPTGLLKTWPAMDMFVCRWNHNSCCENQQFKFRSSFGNYFMDKMSLCIHVYSVYPILADSTRLNHHGFQLSDRIFPHGSIIFHHVSPHFAMARP